MMHRMGEQLMTVEEAMGLSYGDAARDARQRERQSIWAWQTVEGVLSGEVSEAAVSRMMARYRSDR